MDKELFRKTESKLYRYFNKDKQERALKDKLALLDKQIESINRDLKECNINIEPSLQAQQYTERIQTSSDGSSYAEKEIMRVTEIKIRRKTQKQLEKENVLEQLDNIEIECNEIEWKIRDFNGELKKLLELKYKKKYNEEKIAQEMHLNQSQVNRKKQQIINKILMWDIWSDSIKNA